nr:hypothetical protein [Candidatus Sigynarchaeota archaeon]
MTDKKKSSEAWSLEPFVLLMGRISWIAVLVSAIVYFFWAVWWLFILGSYVLLPFVTSTYWWYLISGIASFAILFIYVLPIFVRKVAAKDWEFLATDVLKFGTFRLPKVLFFGILLEIFGSFWGGLPVVIVALCICFGNPPVPVVWKEGAGSKK